MWYQDTDGQKTKIISFSLYLRNFLTVSRESILDSTFLDTDRTKHLLQRDKVFWLPFIFPGAKNDWAVLTSHHNRDLIWGRFMDSIFSIF